MKIYLPFFAIGGPAPGGEFNQNIRTFMRRAGYAVFNDPNTGKASYTHRLGRDYYPRFHVYIEDDKDNRKSINLHLDQKKPSYAGAHAHNGEYEGGRVEQEGNRLEGLIKNQMDNQKQAEPEEKKGFLAKLFR